MTRHCNHCAYPLSERETEYYHKTCTVCRMHALNQIVALKDEKNPTIAGLKKLRTRYGLSLRAARDLMEALLIPGRSNELFNRLTEVPVAKGTSFTVTITPQ